MQTISPRSFVHSLGLLLFRKFISFAIRRNCWVHQDYAFKLSPIVIIALQISTFCLTVAPLTLNIAMNTVLYVQVHHFSYRHHTELTTMAFYRLKNSSGECENYPLTGCISWEQFVSPHWMSWRLKVDFMFQRKLSQFDINFSWTLEKLFQCFFFTIWIEISWMKNVRFKANSTIWLYWNHTMDYSIITIAYSQSQSRLIQFLIYSIQTINTWFTSSTRIISNRAVSSMDSNHAYKLNNLGNNILLIASQNV